MQRVICILALAFTTFLVSCNKYLEIQPEDRLLEGTVYGDRATIRSALNGVYLNLAKPALYGGQYSCTTLDVLAQYYNITQVYNHPFRQIAHYNYHDADAKKYITTLWDSSYTAILNLNTFISQLESDSSKVPQEERLLMLGEAYGLRGFITFDLLRLFGPVYKTDSAKTAIPYPTAPKWEVQPFLPANKVMSNILADVAHAVTLLEKDPVRTQGVRIAASGEDVFFSLRNRRMNYFAARALNARVLLYQGNIIAARDVATAVITDAGTWFPWSPGASTAPGIANPDKVFSSEVLFGLENINLYTVRQAWFLASKPEWQILIPASGRLDDIYERDLNDYRYRSWFIIDPTSNRLDKTFYKYEDVSDPGQLFRHLQPEIRMSEMYYIAAEGAADDNSAAELLNTVRANRGLSKLTINGDRQAQLTKEYQKEFWGEGQLFYYYKRINQSVVINGFGGGTTRMTSAQYVVPLPLSETSFR
ncbi:RagB/SusD family nutrient uptake outer membrane protein [Chitinophaga qingshengii]|uniref:RagB/SusD family nutrient uptake outer membrane protein n=1 Tax=Chitinophaga qingshengii TaxID=1569794 RepID=A0ABR7THN2_9BACT|nr:RagB/SusD family nutrient uptake outer membrane protein [Chitinophaga qingshengii]MBC9930005.1 RagB/SusD family nutrient uptake outer membrane protein [Chitinophaga qingshengii]